MIATVEKDEMRKNTKVMNFVIQSENWDGGENTTNVRKINDLRSLYGIACDCTLTDDELREERLSKI